MVVQAAALTGSLGEWRAAGVSLVVALAIGVLGHVVVYRFLWRGWKRRRAAPAEASLHRRTSPATLAAAIIAALLVALPVAPLRDETAAMALQILRAALIAAITWTVIAAVSVIDDVIIARHDVRTKDNLRARRIHTRVRVLTKSAMLVLGLAGAAGVLTSFPAVRQVGAGLLASAGIAGLVVGLAAKPTLGNLIAGIQIALTEPIRLDDAVVVEGEWGWIEEITATYVVVKIWDDRRLVVPIVRFLEEPFQNWTRTRADLIGSVIIHVDYTCPVDEVEAELGRILEGNPLWDGRVKVLQVVDTTPTTMILRALVSAGDSPTAWDLRCDVRRRLIGWLQARHPGALPRGRWTTMAEPAARRTAPETVIDGAPAGLSTPGGPAEGKA